MGGQPGRSIAAILHQATDNEAIVMVKGVGRIVGIHLLLIIAPTVVTYFMAEVLRDGSIGTE